MTIRERIKQIERALLPGNVPPETARKSLMTLTALLGPVLDEVRDAEREYRHVLAGKMTEAKTKAAAEVQAMTTAEYDRYRVAQDADDLVRQMIVTCRRYLTSIDEEMKLQR
jgi:hypothetical protein